MRGSPKEIYLRSTRSDVQPKWAPDHEEATAVEGSAQLRRAIESAIFQWGFKHGVNRDQARVLLLDRRMP